MDFKEYIESVRGAETLPDDFFDTVTKEYDKLSTDFDTFKGGSVEALKKREEELKAHEAEITRLKAANFDLFSSIPVDKDSGGDENENNDPEEPGGIDSLFK